MSGPVGYIFHNESGKLIHPRGDAYDDTYVVISDHDRPTTQPDRLQFRFIPDQEGKWGYIEHVNSGKVIRPLDDSSIPLNDTPLVLHAERNVASLFTFDQANLEIVHKSGKYWHPHLGYIDPPNNTKCVLHSDRHEAAKFYFGDRNGKPLNSSRDLESSSCKKKKLEIC